jgi:endonuclease/exonuclease/phosphatase (EEP) superfamily protein YafD
MERNNRLIATRHRDLKKNSLHCLLLLFPILTLFFTCTLGFSAEKGIVEFMESMAAQLKEREAFLAEAAEKPLTKNQEKLLTQLLQGNSRFWNPNPLGLGGKTALLERTKPPFFS